MRHEKVELIVRRVQGYEKILSSWGTNRVVLGNFFQRIQDSWWGNSSGIQFWKDVWLEDSSLASKSFQNFIRCLILKYDLIKDYISLMKIQ